MQIRQVRVRNIRSFERGTLVLGPGTTLLWGDVGAGKTSLLYAIEMALFGFAEVDAAHLIRHRASMAEVALSLSEGEHEYVFSRRFHRKMRRGRDTFEPDEKGTGLSVDGGTTHYPATELRQRAIDLLGFPDNPNPRAHSDLWRWAVYVPQERMRQILEAEDSDARLETVRKALGLERYRTAADNAQLVAREFKKDGAARAEESDLLLHWEEDLKHQQAAIQASDAARVAARSAETEGRTALAEVSSAIERVEERHRTLEADRRELGALEARVRELADLSAERTRRLNETTERLRRLETEAEALEKQASERADVLEETARWEEQRRSLIAEIEQLESGRRELDLADARRRDALARQAEAAQALERAERTRTGASQRIDVLVLDGPPSEPLAPGRLGIPEIEAAIREATSTWERASGEARHAARLLEESDELLALGKCPRCGQDVSVESISGHREEMVADLARARSSLDSTLETRDRLTVERSAQEEYERARIRWNAHALLLANARSELDRASAETDRWGKEVTETHARAREAERTAAGLIPMVEALRSGRERLQVLDALGRDLASKVAERARADEAARGRREALLHEHRQAEELRADELRQESLTLELRQRRSELASRLENAAALSEELERLRRRRAETQHQLEDAVGRVQRAEGEIATATDRVHDAERHLRERRALMAKAVRLRDLSTFLAGPFRDGLLELEHRLLGKAKVEFDRSFTKFFAALIEDPALVARSDARFSPYVEIDGELTPAEALSGGERTALALAFRLSLGQVVRSAGRLKLSTLVLDEPTDGFSPEQVDRMGELLADLGIPQIVLVSHEATLSSVADHVVEVRKVGGASELVPEGARTTPSAGPDAA